MNVYTCNTFHGHYPVGASAIVVADNEAEARTLLNAELAKEGLDLQELDELVLVDTTKSHAIILDNGDY